MIDACNITCSSLKYLNLNLDSIRLTNTHAEVSNLLYMVDLAKVVGDE